MFYIFYKNPHLNFSYYAFEQRDLLAPGRSRKGVAVPEPLSAGRRGAIVVSTCRCLHLRLAFGPSPLAKLRMGTAESFSCSEDEP